MQSNKQMWSLLACLIALDVICAFPQERASSASSHRLSADTVADIAYPLPEQELQHIYRFENTLSRLRRAVAELDYEDAAADDMELAEINVFRPLFRYRAEIARQVKNPRQQQFG